MYRNGASGSKSSVINLVANAVFFFSCLRGVYTCELKIRSENCYIKFSWLILHLPLYGVPFQKHNN
jgi:hypothetical protein